MGRGKGGKGEGGRMVETGREKGRGSRVLMLMRGCRSIVIGMRRRGRRRGEIEHEWQDGFEQRALRGLTDNMYSSGEGMTESCRRMNLSMEATTIGVIEGGKTGTHRASQAFDPW